MNTAITEVASDEQCDHLWRAVAAAMNGTDSQLREAVRAALQQFAAPLHARIAELESENLHVLRSRITELKRINDALHERIAALEAQGAKSDAYVAPAPESYSDAQVQAAREILQRDCFPAHIDRNVRAALAAAGVPAQEPVAVLHHVQASDPATGERIYLSCDAASKRIAELEAQLAQRPAVAGVTEPSETRAVELAIGLVEKWLDRKSAETAVLLSNLRRDFGLTAPAPEQPAPESVDDVLREMHASSCDSWMAAWAWADRIEAARKNKLDRDTHPLVRVDFDGPPQAEINRLVLAALREIAPHLALSELEAALEQP